MSPKAEFQSLPGELRNEIYSLMTTTACCDITDADRIKRDRLHHPITAVSQAIAAEWNSVLFRNITFFVRAGFERRGWSLYTNTDDMSSTRENCEQAWDTWLLPLTDSQVASIERIIFYMQDFKLDINVIRTINHEGRRFSFKISGCVDCSPLCVHLVNRFETIENEDGSVGKQALTRIRDVMFDTQESLQRLIGRRKVDSASW